MVQIAHGIDTAMEVAMSSPIVPCPFHIALPAWLWLIVFARRYHREVQQRLTLYV